MSISVLWLMMRIILKISNHRTINVEDSRFFKTQTSLNIHFLQPPISRFPKIFIYCLCKSEKHILPHIRAVRLEDSYPLVFNSQQASGIGSTHSQKPSLCSNLKQFDKLRYLPSLLINSVLFLTSAFWKIF